MGREGENKNQTRGGGSSNEGWTSVCPCMVYPVTTFSPLHFDERVLVLQKSRLSFSLS